MHAELYRIDTINPADHNGVARRCIGQHGVIIAAAAVDEIVLFAVSWRAGFMISNPVINTHVLFYSSLKLTFLSRGRDGRLTDWFYEDRDIYSRMRPKCALFSLAKRREITVLVKRRISCANILPDSIETTFVGRLYISWKVSRYVILLRGDTPTSCLARTC